MYKELLSTDKVGIVVDTSRWMLGINYCRHIIDSNTCGRVGNLLEVGFLCFIIYVAIERKKK